jgi:hypothetical protein
MFNVTDNNYDWREDPKFLKVKVTQLVLKHVCQEVGTTCKTYLMNYLTDPDRDKFFCMTILNLIANDINCKEDTESN